ncbi:MAG: class I SAM-dependent methyltransferase [Acidimicrobiales bacterium]
MAGTSRDLALSFDSVAHTYDDIRPHYPAALFDDIESITGLRRGDRVFEIGCGTGIATRSLLDRGFVVDAVEPGPTMARIALERAHGLPLHVEPGTFETWKPGDRSYTAVFSATAIHWVDPRVRWAKAASVLRDGGHLALATTRTVDGGGFADLNAMSQDLHDEHLFSDFGRSPSSESLETALTAAGDDIGLVWGEADPKGGAHPAGSWFEPSVVRTYHWEQSYDATEAVRLLSTYSAYLAMDDDRRSALMDSLARLVDEELGGSVSRPYLSILAVARGATGN